MWALDYHISIMTVVYPSHDADMQKHRACTGGTAVVRQNSSHSSSKSTSNNICLTCQMVCQHTYAASGYNKLWHNKSILVCYSRRLHPSHNGITR